MQEAKLHMLMLVEGGQRLWPPLLQTEFENQAYTKYHFLTCEKRNISSFTIHFKSFIQCAELQEHYMRVKEEHQ